MVKFLDENQEVLEALRVSECIALVLRVQIRDFRTDIVLNYYLFQKSLTNN